MFVDVALADQCTTQHTTHGGAAAAAVRARPSACSMSAKQHPQLMDKGCQRPSPGCRMVSDSQRGTQQHTESHHSRKHSGSTSRLWQVFYPFKPHSP